MSPNIIDFRSIICPARPSRHGRSRAGQHRRRPADAAARKQKLHFITFLILAPIVILAILTIFYV